MYTLNDLSITKQLHYVNKFADRINDAKNLHDNMKDVECMIYVCKDDSEGGAGWECYYYLVHPERRIIFWLEDFNARPTLIEIDGVDSDTHISEQ